MIAWIHLTSGLWWPGIVTDTTDDMLSQSPNLRIAKLFDKEIIAVDISQEECFQSYGESDSFDDIEAFITLHRDQVTPENQSESFMKAVKELSGQLEIYANGIKKAAETSQNQVTRTTKRLSAISWDSYFMAVAFLSA